APRDVRPADRPPERRAPRGADARPADRPPERRAPPDRAAPRSEGRSNGGQARPRSDGRSHMDFFPQHSFGAPSSFSRPSFWGGLAMVVGIMVGTGIFRTPGLVAQRLGRPALTFVAWAAGGAIAFLGALIFAELATRHPNAGGKYVYAREAFGKRAGFVVGWIEGLVYAVATAAIGVVAGEYAGRLVGVGDTRWL